MRSHLGFVKSVESTGGKQVLGVLFDSNPGHAFLRAGHLPWRPPWERWERESGTKGFPMMDLLLYVWKPGVSSFSPESNLHFYSIFSIRSFVNPFQTESWKLLMNLTNFMLTKTRCWKTSASICSLLLCETRIGKRQVSYVIARFLVVIRWCSFVVYVCTINFWSKFWSVDLILNRINSRIAYEKKPRKSTTLPFSRVRVELEWDFSQDKTILQDFWDCFVKPKAKNVQFSYQMNWYLLCCGGCGDTDQFRFCCRLALTPAQFPQLMEGPRATNCI